MRDERWRSVSWREEQKGGALLLLNIAIAAFAVVSLVEMAVKVWG